MASMKASCLSIGKRDYFCQLRGNVTAAANAPPIGYGAALCWQAPTRSGNWQAKAWPTKKGRPWRQLLLDEELGEAARLVADQQRGSDRTVGGPHVHCKRAVLLAAGQVPDLQRTVARSGDDGPTVGRYRHAMHFIGRPAEGPFLLAGCQISDLQRTGVRAGDGGPAVGRNRHAKHPVGMPAQGS